MVKSMSFSEQQLSLVEFTQFIAAIPDAVAHAQISLDDSLVNGILKYLKEEQPRLENAIKMSRASHLTQSLKDAQQLRLEDLQSLYDALKGYRSTRNEVKKTSYTNLKKLFEKYKEVKTANQEQSLILVKSLLSKLNSDLYRDDISNLNLQDHVENLKASQADFYNLYLSKTKEGSDQVKSETKELRQKILKKYRILQNHLKNQVDYDETSDYAQLYSLLMEIRAKHAESYKRRQTASAHKKATKEESEDNSEDKLVKV